MGDFINKCVESPEPYKTIELQWQCHLTWSFQHKGKIFLSDFQIMFMFVDSVVIVMDLFFKGVDLKITLFWWFLHAYSTYIHVYNLLTHEK